MVAVVEVFARFFRSMDASVHFSCGFSAGHWIGVAIHKGAHLVSSQISAVQGFPFSRVSGNLRSVRSMNLYSEVPSVAADLTMWTMRIPFNSAAEWAASPIFRLS
jgi:hypothetical protein